MAEHNTLGTEGEQLAAAYLEAQGYSILVRNYTFRKGEIDIIARLDDLIVMVEVKTRSTADFGNPQDFLKPNQIKRLVATANHYLEQLEDALEVRFDIVAVIKNKSGTNLEHIKDAFYHF